MPIRRLLVALIIMTVSACHSSLKGPPLRQGIFSYYKESYKLCPELFEIGSESPCKKRKNEYAKVILIDGPELKKCIDSENVVLVYLWRPNCRSGNCIALNRLQSYCSKKQIELFVVAEYFDVDEMKRDFSLDKYIFAINPTYYSSDLQSRYIKAFIVDLTSLKLSKEEGRFLLFKNTSFFGQYSNLDQLNKVIL